MGRKTKYSKEVKIQACIDYDKGKGSFFDIAKKIGTHHSVINRWYLSYKEHGCSIFDESNSNSSYSKDFKLQVINEYISGKYSSLDLSTKYNISNGLICTCIQMD